MRSAEVTGSKEGLTRGVVASAGGRTQKGGNAVKDRRQIRTNVDGQDADEEACHARRSFAQRRDQHLSNHNHSTMSIDLVHESDNS